MILITWRKAQHSWYGVATGKNCTTKEEETLPGGRVIEKLDGIFSMLSGCAYKGYGNPWVRPCCMEDMPEADGMDREYSSKTMITPDNKNIYGSYVHGLFDHESMANSVVQALAKRKGIEIEGGVFENYQAYKEKQYDKLADTLRKYLNMEVIYGILKEAHLE